MGVLDEIQQEIRRVAERAGAAVVGIGHRWGAGSGVVLSEGHVLTNAHNVRRDGIVVTFADGHTADGQVRGADVDGDLAVVEVDTAGSRPSSGRASRPRTSGRRSSRSPTRVGGGCGSRWGS